MSGQEGTPNGGDRLAQKGKGVLAMRLRLDSIRHDEVGWLATFYGKPDVRGNSFQVPISDEQAEQMVVGNQYLFVHVVEDGAL